VLSSEISNYTAFGVISPEITVLIISYILNIGTLRKIVPRINIAPFLKKHGDDLSLPASDENTNMLCAYIKIR
jgi:hypothetical protein